LADIIFLKKEDYVKKVVFSHGDALFHPLLFKFLGFQMSNHFNVSLFSMSKYNKKELQLVSWLILIFKKEDYVRKVVFSHGDALFHPILFKFLRFQMSNHFIVSLFPMSKYNNKELQLVSLLILIF